MSNDVRHVTRHNVTLTLSDISEVNDNVLIARVKDAAVYGIGAIWPLSNGQYRASSWACGHSVSDSIIVLTLPDAVAYLAQCISPLDYAQVIP